MPSQVDFDDSNSNSNSNNHNHNHGDIESCDQTNATGTVTLPLEEVLRLTTPEEDEFPSEREFQNNTKERQRQQQPVPSSNTRPTSKSPKTGRKKTKRKSSGATTSELKRAVKNEKKSVNKVVAAAIQNYEDSPSSLKKTRVTPKRTKSGSSRAKKKRATPVAPSLTTTSNAALKKELKNKPVVESSIEKAQTKVLKSDDSWIVRMTEDKSDASFRPLHGVESAVSLQSIEKAGAIAVFPFDSEHHTRRRSVTNPGRISDIDMEAIKDLEAQTPKGSKQRSTLDSTTITYEEVPEPPQSQVIHAVATYTSSQQPPSVRRSETEGTYGSSSAKTAPTVSLGSTTKDGIFGSTTLQDSESGTVTAKAISSENYYEEVRRQLQKEAVAAVAVVPLTDDGKPLDKDAKNFAKSKGEKDKDDRKGIQKYAWLGCAMGLLVIILVIVFVTYKRKLRRIDAQEPEDPPEGGFEACDGDMNCFMDIVMNSDLGLYWRQRITKILPRSTLENLLQDSDFSSPHHKAFYFLIKNAENLYGVDNMVDMLNEELDPLEKSRVNSIFALVTIYEAMNGDNWHVKTNWLRPEIDICKWHGVHCEGELLAKENVAVAEAAAEANKNRTPIDNSFAITGPPPGDLDDDTLADDGMFAVGGFVVDDDDDTIDQGAIGERYFSIHNLELQANNLKGSIPDEILMLSNMLGLLDLSTNAITGTIPTELARLNRLRGFDVHNNQLESFIPSELSKMMNLRLFDVSNNPSLSGRPIQFESWSNIENLQIQGTTIRGAVPEDFCTMLETRKTGDKPFELKYSEEFVFRASCPDKVDCPCCTECCNDDSNVCEPNII